MEGVELTIPAPVVVPNLMGSEVLGGARASGVGDAECSDAGRGLVFSSPKMKKSSALVSQRAGSERKKLQKKEGRVPRSSTGCFKTPRTQQLETSMSTSEDIDMNDASDELGSHIIKNSYAEKSQQQQLKHKNNSNSKRGDRRSSKVLLKNKNDGMAGFSLASGGNKVFGTYGLKPDVRDITKLIDNISVNDLLDGSYKCPNVAKEKGRRPANTRENILHSVRKAISVFQYQGLSQANKQNDEDVVFSNEIPSLSNSNACMASNLDVDEENCPASDLSCAKVQESCVNTEAPCNTCDLPLYHPRDVIEKLALPLYKDLDSLLMDAAKPATLSRCNDPRPGKSVSHRVTLSSSWSHNYNGHIRSNSDSIKVSSRSSCQGRWVRIGKTASFLRGGTESFADLDSLTYDHSLVPSGSVKYILPETAKTVSKISSSLASEQASLYVICPTSSDSPAALHSPRVMTAAQALYDIANASSNKTANGIIKWPKQPSEEAMKARRSKSIQSSESLLTPKSEIMDHAKPLKKPKLLIFEKRDHSDRANGTRALHLWSAPRSSRSSPIRVYKESASDANRHQMNGSFPKPLFMAPPRRVSEKNNHSQQKLRKVLQTDWNRGKGQS